MLLLAAAAPAAAADWPQYRGPDRDGRSPETDLATRFPEGGPPVLWRLPLGDGYSGIAVAGGRVFTLFGSGGHELVLAVDAATGRELWRHRLDRNRPDSQGGGPRSTPTVDADTVYVHGASGKLAAFDAATGEVRWQTNLVATYGARVPQWGFAGSPAVEGDLLLVEVGGRSTHALVAFDKATGRTRWASQTDAPGYSSPLVAELAGVRQALFFTAGALVSVDPASGRLHWRIPWKTSYDVNAAMPVVVPPDRIFISSGYDTGATLLQVVRHDGGALDARQVWRSRVMKNHFNSSVLVGDHLYGFDNAILKCLHAATGEERWKARGHGKGSLLYAAGHLYVLGESGELAVVEATPEGYREVARAPLLTGRSWTMPALAEGRLYLRNQGEMIAVDLRPARGEGR